MPVIYWSKSYEHDGSNSGNFKWNITKKSELKNGREKKERERLQFIGAEKTHQYSEVERGPGIETTYLKINESCELN